MKNIYKNIHSNDGMDLFILAYSEGYLYASLFIFEWKRPSIESDTLFTTLRDNKKINMYDDVLIYYFH